MADEQISKTSLAKPLLVTKSVACSGTGFSDPVASEVLRLYGRSDGEMPELETNPDTKHIFKSIKEERSHITRLRLVMSDAASELMHRQLAIDRYTNQLCQQVPSPIQTLPPELIIAMFKEYVAALRDDFLKSITVLGWLGKNVLVLTHVCRLWRNLAIETSELWSKLELRIPIGMSPNAFTRYVDGAKIWLDRARPSQSIDLQVRDDRWTGGRRIRSVLLDAVLGERWHSIQSVSLALPHDHFHDLIPLDTDGLSTCAPHLTDVFLYSVSHPPDDGYPFIEIQETNLPWGQLRHLHLSAILVDLQDLYVVFIECKKLLRCSFRAEYWEDPEDDASFVPTTLPELRMLVLKIEGTSVDQPDGSAKFLGGLTLPSLEILALNYADVESAISNFDVVRQLQTRSKFSLLTFKMSGAAPSITDLLGFLNTSPDMSTFCLDKCWHNDMLPGRRERLLNSMIWREGCMLLPKLAYFSMWARPNDAYSRTKLCEMVDSRVEQIEDADAVREDVKPAVCLKELQLYGTHNLEGMHVDFVAGVQRWRQGGLQVTLREEWTDPD